MTTRSSSTGFERATAAACLLAGFIVLTPAASAQEPFEWAEILEAGRTLEIKGINGSIEAAAAGGQRAEVVAVKSARRSDPASVRIDLVEENGNITICAVYLDDPANECRTGEGGRMRVRDNDVVVEFTVRVPAGVRFVARNVNGGIDVDGVDGDVEAYTVNGSVEIRADGVVRAETVNGSIDASMGSSNWQDTIAFETVNGRISVGIPEDVSTAFEAETVNGSIRSDFPVTVSGRFGPRRMSGRIDGDGPANGRRIRLKTVNGGIRLRRSS